METGFALPVCLRLIVQSSVPLPSFFERMLLMSNSYGFKKAGSFNSSSNCFPLSDLISIKKVLSPTICSALPKPVMDFNIVNDLLQSKWKSWRLVVHSLEELLKERILGKEKSRWKAGLLYGWVSKYREIKFPSTILK